MVGVIWENGGHRMRLIDADAIPESATAISTDGRLFVAWSEIVKAPTISPESIRPKGRWEKHHTSKYGAAPYFCSCCFDIWESEQINNMKFCPSCGADMTGE